MNLYRILLTIFAIWCAGCNTISNTDVETIATTDSLTPIATVTEVQVTINADSTTTPITSAVETKTPTPQIKATVTNVVENQVYLAEKFSFQFTIPDNYLLFEHEHPDALLVISLHEASVMADDRIHKPEIFITVHHNEENVGVRAWFEAHTAETLTEMYPIYVGPRHVQTQEIAGRAALTFEDMTFSHAYVTLVEGEDYILALGFVPFDYPGLAEDFETVLDSLIFGDLSPP